MIGQEQQSTSMTMMDGPKVEREKLGEDAWAVAWNFLIGRISILDSWRPGWVEGGWKVHRRGEAAWHEAAAGEHRSFFLHYRMREGIVTGRAEAKRPMQ